MSHRAEDAYEYVALDSITTGTVTAFHKGDPVPADTVEAHGWLDAGLVIHRDLYSPEGDHADPEQTPVLRRGEIPARLQDSAVVAKPDDAKTSDESGKTAAKSPARKSTTDKKEE
jgi:hypothetical protein